MAITYNVYKGSEKIASDLAEKTYTVDGLDPATEYTFGVTKVENGTESVKATLKVTTANQPVTGITPSQQTMSIKVGDADRAVSFTVAPDNATNKELTIESTNPAAATYVDGKVHPVAEGTTDITATAKDGSGVTAKIAVTVSPAVE